MKNLKDLDLSLQAIAVKRNELSKLKYDNPTYDDKEEELHDLEDSLMEQYEEDLDDVLKEIHNKYCPDSDILLPTAYLAKTYSANDKKEFSAASGEGVFVEILPDDKPAKLVLVPGPLRFVLNIGAEQRVVWEGGK